jgi:hypothetical protein
LHLTVERSSRPFDLDLTIDRARLALDLDLAFNRSPSRTGDGRITFDRLADRQRAGNAQPDPQSQHAKQTIHPGHPFHLPVSQPSL